MKGTDYFPPRTSSTEASARIKKVEELTPESPVLAPSFSKMLALKEKCHVSSCMFCRTLSNVAPLPSVEHFNDNSCLQGQIVTCLLREDEIY